MVSKQNLPVKQGTSVTKKDFHEKECFSPQIWLPQERQGFTKRNGFYLKERIPLTKCKQNDFN